MKTTKWLLAAIIAIGGACTIPSCSQANNAEMTAETPSSDVAQSETHLTAIERYLADSLAPMYQQAQLFVPCVLVVDVDSSNVEDIKVWGDFWVFNYNVVGDTLKTVSGGSHPGLMHLRKSASRFEVTAFDRVEDGSDFLPSAKRIFGDKFEAFQKINSDDQAHEQFRANRIADEVRNKNLPCTFYQDYGWPAKKLPL